MISPTAIYAVLLLAAPLATVLLYSVFTGGKGQMTTDFTLENYRQVWGGAVYRAIMARSLLVALLVTLVTVVIAYPIAYFVSFHASASKKSMWLFLITIPFWTSYLIRVFLWKVILDFGGVLNSFLLKTGLAAEPVTWFMNSPAAVVITLAHAYAPFAILPIFVALEKIDRSLLEAGQDLGESALMTFWRVTLPLAMPGVVAAVLIVFIPTIGDYVTPQLVGGSEGRMVANLIYLQYMRLDNYPAGSALAVSAMLMVTAISLVFIWLNRRFLRATR